MVFPINNPAITLKCVAAALRKIATSWSIREMNKWTVPITGILKGINHPRYILSIHFLPQLGMQEGKGQCFHLCGIWSIFPKISGSLWQHDMILHTWTTQDQYEKHFLNVFFVLFQLIPVMTHFWPISSIIPGIGSEYIRNNSICYSDWHACICSVFL